MSGLKNFNTALEVELLQLKRFGQLPSLNMRLGRVCLFKVNLQDSHFLNENVEDTVSCKSGTNIYPNWKKPAPAMSRGFPEFQETFFTETFPYLLDPCNCIDDCVGKFLINCIIVYTCFLRKLLA